MNLTYKPLFAILLCVLSAFAAKATVWPVSVINFQFSNNPTTVTVGDTILWTWGSGSHTTTSTSVPIGATTWNAPINSSNTTYQYVVAVAGLYNYKCTPHASSGMTASFTALGGPCSFTTEITPTNLILCPNSSDTLFASPAGGMYQWMKDGNPITGATNQFLVVTSANDAGSQFTVQVTVDACTDESAEVLVDGWVFLPPSVSQSPNGWMVGDVTHLCAGNNLILTLLAPYTTNIQWFNASGPIIGANSNSFIVDETGIYTVSGAPAQCPDYVATFNLGVNVLVSPPLVPVITESNDSLFGTIGIYNYQWYLNGEPIAGATNTNYVPTASGVYAVSVMDEHDCAGLSDLFVFTVTNPCSVNAEVSPTNLVLCPNSTDTLFAFPSGGSYQWYKNNVAIPGATNTFYVVNSFDDAAFYFQAEVTIDSCTDKSDSVLVDGWVFLPPLVMQSPNGVVDINGVTHICAGDTLTLTLMSPYTNNIQWYNEGEPIPGANSANFYAVTAGSYTVSGAPAQCPSFNQTMGIPIQLEVNIPTVPIITASNDTLYANPMVTPYTWYFNGNVMAGENNYFIIPSQPGLYNASMTDINQCSGISGPYAFGLVDTCSWEPSITPNNLNLCPNTGDTLFVSPGGGAYQWYRNGLPIAGAMNPYFLVNSFVDEGAQISVIAVLNGCIDTSVAVTVNVLSFPPSTVLQNGGWLDTSGITHSCVGETVTLTLTPPYNTNIQWFNGDPIAGGTNQTLDVTVGGAYTVNASPAACPNYNQTVGPIVVTFSQPTVPEITQSNDTLFAYPAADTGYQWLLDGTEISGATNSWYVVTGSGSYTVMLNDSNQCSGVSSPHIISGVNEVENVSINIYPNPVQDELTISYSGNTNLQYRIYDVTGKMIQQGSCQRSINTNKLTTGTYLLRIIDKQHEAKSVFLKE